MKVVYKAFPGADLEESLEALEAAGLSPLVLDNPRPNPILLRFGRTMVRIRVAVEDDEEEAAKAALREWESRETPEADRHAKAFEKQALVLLGIGSLWFVLSQLRPEFPWYWIFGPLLVGYIALLWVRASREARMPGPPDE
jgi:hypothetical protein